MKISVILSLLLLLFSISVHAQQVSIDNAVDYNDYIIVEQMKIAEMIKVVSKTIETGNLIQINQSIDELIVQIDQSIDAVKSLLPFDGNVAFRDAAISLFGFYRSMAGNEYRQLAALVTKKEYTDADIVAINEIIVSITEKEKPIDEQFLNEQKLFAAKHNFTVAPAAEVSEDKGPVPKATVVEEKVSEMMNTFIQCMQNKDQDCMKLFLDRDFLISENLEGREYVVNYFVPENYLIQRYDDSSGIVTVYIWWGDYLTVHKLTFMIVRKDEKYFIIPSRFQNNYLDPWLTVDTNINKSAK